MDYETVRRLLDYDPLTGIVTWRISISCHKAGSRAGSPGIGGIRRLKSEGVYYQLPRLIWLWMTEENPPASVDHRNGDGLDDRWENLGSVSVEDEMTPELIRELLDYDPENGQFIWRVNRHKHRAGTIAGVIDAAGYRRIKIGGINHAAHRLAFLWMEGRWPEADIDHRNMMKSDNRWCNIREATQAENRRNRVVRQDNVVQIKGVLFRRGKYSARIKADGVNYYLGSFETLEAATEAYRKASERLHLEFARS